MKFVDDSKISLAWFGFILACVVSVRHVCAEFTFSAPANLGPVINSQAAEAGACISADGLSLYFDSDRPGGLGDWDLWQVSIEPVVDFNGDEKVDLIDFCKLGQYWLQDEPSVDIGPTPLGDRVIDIHDLSVLADYWLTDFRLLSHWKLDETTVDFSLDLGLKEQ